MFPGIRAKFIPGQAYISQQTQNPLADGSYSYFAPGDFTTFHGYQGEREGNVHFDGDGTVAFARIGYMDGVVRSGEGVATELANY